MLKADLHIHTQYSFDCTTSPEEVIRRCQKLRINCIAIADHGSIAGALRVKEIAPFRVIVAEEVLTPLGEIMGMFLKEQIPTNIPAEEAVRQIKAQNGLVCLPHPFDQMRGINRQGFDEIRRLLPQIDIIEVFNARALRFGNSNGKALAFAKENRLLKSAGSDAHIAREIGHAYLEMPEFDDVAGFRQALAQGRIHGAYTCPMVHAASTFKTLKKKLLRR